MLTVWTKHLNTENERNDFARYLRQSKPVFERLHAILLEQEQRTEELETSVKAYDNPNWPYKQAHRNGFKDCLNQVKELVNPDQWRAHD